MIKRTLLFVLLLLLSTAHILGQKEANFNWVIPLNSSYVPLGTASSELIAVRENSQVLLIAENGDKTPLSYDSIACMHGNFWSTWTDGLQGVYHYVKGEILPPVYDNVKLVSKSDDNWAFLIRKYGMTAIVNDQNKLLAPYQKAVYADLSFIGDSILGYLKHKVYRRGRADIFYVSKHAVEIKERIAKRLLPPKFKRISSEQYVFDLYDGDAVQSDTFVFANAFVKDLAIVKKDSLFGYWQRKGSWLIPPRFQSALPFDASGLAVVKQNGKYGVVQKDGVFILEPTFAFLKPAIPDLFEFKEGGKIGLVNTAGDVILSAGDYRGFQTAGTKCFGALSGDTVLIFRRDGTFIPLSSVSKCSRVVFDENFWVTISNQHPAKGRRKVLTWGVMSPGGDWRIPNTASGRTFASKHFFLVEARSTPCCKIGGVNFSNSQGGKYLIFNRKGEPLISILTDIKPTQKEADFIIYRYENKFGLITKNGDQIPAEYDMIRANGNGWVVAQKGDAWGALKWLD